MSSQRRPVRNPCECPKCGRVGATEIRIQHFSDESAHPIMNRDIRDQLLDFGRCEVAANAVVPGKPTVTELSDCPILEGI